MSLGRHFPVGRFASLVSSRYHQTVLVRGSFGLVFLLAIAQFGSAASRQTEPMECGDVRRGTEIERRTDAIGSRDRSLLAFADIVLRRSAADHDGTRCQAVYRFFVQERGSTTRQVKKLAEVRSSIVGVTLVGFSPDELTVAADFWWAEGDYTAVRPVIYSLKNRTSAIRELDDSITRQLPSCDYFQTFARITNSGEAIIHVPQSHYVETGCPDQGDWTFNPRTGRVRRGGEPVNR